MQPEITVLMPNYNNAAFLKEAIDSILNQTYTDFIFLIVDDGSTDNSVEVIRGYNDKRIQLVCKEKNSGIVDALNIGLENTTTKYAIRMDGDDLSDKNRLQVLYRFMENNPGIGVCGSEIQTFGDVNDLWTYRISRDEIKASLIYNAGVGHASCIYRMSVFRQNGIRYSNNFPYMEDYDLFFRLKSHTDFGNVPQTLYYYRILKHNSTVRNRDSIYDRYRKIYAVVLAELGIEPSEENIQLQLEFFIHPVLSKPIAEYKKWVRRLLAANKESRIYPQEALETILEHRWRIFFYKIAPLSLRKNIEYFRASGKIEKSQLSYLVKSKIKDIFGKKVSSQVGQKN